jgi:hypothetical protein
MEFGMLSHWWDGSLERVLGRLASRKFNGWSALWDGGVTRGELATDIPWYYKGIDRPKLSTGLWSLGRDNKPKVLEAPEYFIKNLPKGIPLHGELWYNDRLDMIKRYCSRTTMYHPVWYSIKFIAFNIKPYPLWEGIEKFTTKYNLDNPMDDFNNWKYRDVISHFNILNRNENLDFIKTEKITSKEQLLYLQKKAIDNQWEGLIFANPDGVYECKRSHNSLKWKSRYDYEATVIGYELGKTGKNIGKIGSIIVKFTWDYQIISIYGGKEEMIDKSIITNISGLTDQERKVEYINEVYPIGSKLKFTFFGVTVHGVPVSANIYRE